MDIIVPINAKFYYRRYEKPLEIAIIPGPIVIDVAAGQLVKSGFCSEIPRASRVIAQYTFKPVDITPLLTAVRALPLPVADEILAELCVSISTIAAMVP